MSYAFAIPLLSAIANLVLAITVYRQGPPRELRDAFVFLSVMLVFWNLTFFVLYSVPDPRLALELSRIARVGSFFMVAAVFHVAVAVQSDRSPKMRLLLLADYSVAVALVCVNALGLYVSELRGFAWGYYSVRTPFYHLFTSHLVINFVGAAALLAHDYRATTSPGTRLQLRFWVLGAAIALPLGLTNLLPAYGVPFFPLGNLGSAVWAGIVAYAIVRHRLMDIDIVLTKGMAYAAVSFLVLTPVFLITLWLQRVSFGDIHPDFSMALLGLFVVVGSAFPALRLRAEHRIESSLFREKHEYRTAMSAFMRSIIRIIDRERLVAELTSTLSSMLRVRCIAVILEAYRGGGFRIASAVPGFAATHEYPADHPLVRFLASRQQAVLLDELDSESPIGDAIRVADVLRDNGWQVCLPLRGGGRLIGLIGIGEKEDVEAFSAGDLALLEMLGAEASVALENARLYEELRSSQNIIRRADRLSSLGTLAAGIAHEIRNPLVAIQTFFQLAPERLHDEEFLTSFLAVTAAEVKRIADLITELLSFARSPTRTLGPVDLNGTIESVATLLEPEAKKHRVIITRGLGVGLLRAAADADQLKQLLLNLVLNAIQATPAGGFVSLASTSVQREGNDFVRVEIADNGVGIEPERLDHIFDPFFTTKDTGTGLGLSIAHQIVVEHGGTIEVKSVPGEGTMFRVDLPAARPAGGRVESASVLAGGERDVLACERVGGVRD